MADPAPTQDPMKHPSVRLSRLKHRWPFFAWLLAAVTVTVLIYQQGGTRTLAGVGEKQITEINPVEAARIKVIEVATGQEVKKGQRLAILEPSVLETEWASVQAAHALDFRQAQRRFDDARLQAEAELNSLKLNKAREQAELAVLDAEVQRLQGLFDRRLIDGQDLVDLKARREALKAGLTHYPASIKQLEETIAWATSGRQTLAAEVSPELRKAYERRKELFELLAPHDGVVASVLRKSGETVSVREVVMTLAHKHSHRVIALVPEERALGVQMGQPFRVQSRMAARGEDVPATVSALSPEIIGMPQQRVLVPGRVVRGRRIILDLQGEHTFLPGEAVQVRSTRSLLSRPVQAEERSSDDTP